MSKYKIIINKKVESQRMNFEIEDYIKGKTTTLVVGLIICLVGIWNLVK